jgi:HipA-like protein
MRQAMVLFNNVPAGTLTETNNREYVFRYLDAYLMESGYPSISVRLPKSNKEFQSEVLFPFFFNMLSEGANKQLQTRFLKIDEDDYFGLLLKTAAHETIGAITVKELDD